MAGYVLTIAGGKGGVGKTTTAVNIGGALKERGYDVVVVDADLGMANLGTMLDIDHEVSLHEVLAGEADLEAAIEEGPGGLTVLAGEQSLEAFADADPAELKKVVRSLRNGFDVVVIDTGAGLSHEVAVPLGLADSIILVTTPDAVAVGDTVKTAEMSGRIDGSVEGTILNRVTPHTEVGPIAERFNVPLLALIPDEPRETQSEPVVFKSPGSNTADAFGQLASNIDTHVSGKKELGHMDVVMDESWFPDEEGGTHQQVSENLKGSWLENEPEEKSGRFGIF